MISPLFFKPLQLSCSVFLFAVILSGIACNNSPGDTASNKLPAIKKTDTLETSHSTAISEVTVQADSTQSYYLYVPSEIDSSTMLLVFFDPGADGQKPVKKYRNLAQRYGIVLAGSNNSKNGLSREESAAIAKKLLDDVQQRLGINKKNVLACGFSGGARVAVLTALSESLTGAIGCGAGFPGKPEKNYGFSYVGIVGNEDFNFLEFKRLYADLDRVHMKHQLLVFDGKHEWAPENEMEKAVLLMKNDSSSQQILSDKIDSSIAVYKKQKSCVRLYDELRFGITSGLDTSHISAWRAELRPLRKSGECITEMKMEAEIETQEANAQTEIAKAFSTKDFTQLDKKIGALKLQSTKKSSLQKLSDQRLLQFASLMGFLYSEKALASDLGLAKKYLDLYKKADPTNPDYHYLMACYFVKSGKKPDAISALQKAVDNGFDDIKKLESNSTLQVLQHEPEYSPLIQRIFK